MPFLLLASACCECGLRSIIPVTLCVVDYVCGGRHACIVVRAACHLLIFRRFRLACDLHAVAGWFCRALAFLRQENPLMMLLGAGLISVAGSNFGDGSQSSRKRKSRGCESEEDRQFTLEVD
jgi:hypothetical protein